MKLFYWLYSKITGFVSKLADNDPDTVKRVIHAEIAKGKNQLQTLCMQEAALKSQLVTANISVEELKKQAKEVREAVQNRITNITDADLLKKAAITVLNADGLVTQQKHIIESIEKSIESIRLAQSDLRVQIMQAELHLSEITAGLVVVNARTFKIEVSDKVSEYKTQIAGKTQYLDMMAYQESSYSDSDITETINKLKGTK